MVLRLVRRRLLSRFAGAQSARAGGRNAESVTRRFVAASDESVALRSAVEHSAGVSVCGLWIASRGRHPGGAWRHQTKVSRCAARSSIPPEFQYADYGFRVARDIQALR